MCYTIKSENVLANYFANTDSNVISFRDLKRLRKEIEEMFDYNIYVDITYDAVNKAISSNKELYSKDEFYVVLNDDAKNQIRQKVYIEENFNWRIPEKIKNRYLHYFETIKDEE